MPGPAPGIVLDNGPGPAPVPLPEPPPRPGIRKHYDLVLKNQDLRAFLTELALKEGVELRFVGYFYLGMKAGTLRNATFEEALSFICKRNGLQFRVAKDGCFVVGYPMDLVMEFAEYNDATTVDAFYHCSALDPDSLSTTLARAFPGLLVLPGPLFASPTLEFAGAEHPQGTAGGVTPKGFTTTDAVIKRDDIILRGPAWLVKRAMAFVGKLDRKRRQVRINLRMVEMTDTASKELGIDWNFGVAGGSTTSITEIPNPALPGPVGNKGITFGSFSHSPVSFNVSFQAQELKGHVKTLANPSIMVLDGERCFIHLGDRLLYPKQNGVNAQGLPTFDVAELQTGVYLQMAVDLGNDDDVVLDLYPQASYIASYQNYLGNPYPVIATREAQTTVRLKSGELMAIGGLRQVQDTKEQSGLPGLGLLPLLSHLFSDKFSSHVNDNLTILVQPEIIQYDAGETSTITPVD